MLDGVFLGVRGIDDVVGEAGFFLVGQLAVQAGFDLGAAQAAALHGSLDLFLTAADDGDEAVKTVVTSSFHQDGRFHNYDGAGVMEGDGGDQGVLAAADGGVNDAVEAFETVGVIEDEGGKGAAVDLAVGGEDGRAELADDVRVGFAVFGQYLVAEIIGLDEMAAELFEGAADEGFAAGQAAGEAYEEHGAAGAARRRDSAERTVLDMSMAMVRGPTPPGTGVRAPATSGPSTGWTSPMRMLPLAAS